MASSESEELEETKASPAKLALQKIEAELRQRRLDEFCSALDGQRRIGFMTDFVVVCGGREFPVHRVVLATGSSYFRAMFDSGMVEATSGRADLQGLDADVFEVLLDYLYTGKSSEVGLDRATAVTVMEAANMLQMDDLLDHTLDVLAMRFMCVDDYIDDLHHAETYNRTGRVRRVLEFVNSWLSACASTADFARLSSSHVKRIAELDTGIASTRNIVCAVLRWAKADPANRSKEIRELLSAVDWNDLPKSFLSELVENEPLLSRTNKVLRKKMKRATPLPDDPVYKTVLFFSCQSNSMQLINLNEEADVDAVPLPFTLTAGSVAVSHRKCVYFVGGLCLSKRITRYSPSTNTFAAAGSLREYVSLHSAGVVARDEIYVVGSLLYSLEAWDKNVVQRYCPSTGVCRKLDSRPNQCYRHPSLVSLSGFVYIYEYCPFGDNSWLRREMERYDPVADQWTEIDFGPSHPSAIVGASDEKLYEMDPRLSPSELRIHNVSLGVTKRRSTRLPEMRGQFPLSYMFALRLGNGANVLLVVQCCRVARDAAAFYLYYPETGEWEKRLKPAIACDYVVAAE